MANASLADLANATSQALAENATALGHAVRGVMSSNGTVASGVKNSTLGTGAAGQGQGGGTAFNATNVMPGAEFGWAAYFQAIGAVFLVLALIMLGFWLLKRYGPKAGMSFLGRGDLKFEGQISLGQKRSIAVVRFLNKRLVVGVTDNSINLLTEMQIDHDDETDFDKSLEREARKGSTGSKKRRPEPPPRGTRGKGGSS